MINQPLVLLLVIAGFNAGCTYGNWLSVYRTYRVDKKDSLQSTVIDAKQSVVIAKRRTTDPADRDGTTAFSAAAATTNVAGTGQTVVCAEPSPDALAAVSDILTASAKVDAKAHSGSTTVGNAIAESVEQLNRARTIQLLRDEFFSACLGYANGALDRASYIRLVRKYSDGVVTLLGIEQITPQAKALSTTISAPGTQPPATQPGDNTKQDATDTGKNKSKGNATQPGSTNTNPKTDSSGTPEKKNAPAASDPSTTQGTASHASPQDATAFRLYETNFVVEEAQALTVADTGNTPSPSVPPAQTPAPVQSTPDSTGNNGSASVTAATPKKQSTPNTGPKKPGTPAPTSKPDTKSDTTNSDDSNQAPDTTVPSKNVVKAVQFMVSRYLTNSLAQECVEYFSDPYYPERQYQLTKNIANAAGPAASPSQSSSAANSSPQQTTPTPGKPSSPTPTDPMWGFCQTVFTSAVC